MKISASDFPQPLSDSGQSKAPRRALAETGSENYETADLLTISAAAMAGSSSAGRVQQLKLQVDSAEYHPSSASIARGLITDALARA